MIFVVTIKYLVMDKELFVAKELPLEIKAKNIPGAFDECDFIELSTSNLYCIAFQVGGQVSDFSGDGQYYGDLVPINFPKKMMRFIKPVNATDGDFLPPENSSRNKIFVPVDSIADGEDGPVATFLLHGLIKDVSAIQENVFEQSLRNNHICEHKQHLLGNGQACSTMAKVSNSEEPVVFYLNMQLTEAKTPRGLNGENKEPGKVETNRGFKIDHFLIPTVLPNRTILWVAIKNTGSGSENKQAIKRWTSPLYGVASSGDCYFLDEAGIMVTFEEDPKSVSGVGNYLAKLVATTK